MLLSMIALVVGIMIAIGRGGHTHARSAAAIVARDTQPRSQAAVTTTTQRATTRPAGIVSTTTTSVPIAAPVARSAPTGPPWSVRQAIFDFYDPTRMSPARGTSRAHLGRELRTTLRWPVSPNGLVAPGLLPLMVFAHGYNVSAATYAEMLDDLARAGIVVAAPEFPGESTAYPGPAVESDLVNEPCDMEFVAASLENHPPSGLRDAIRHAPLIVAGHSDGATAAAWAGYASTCSSEPIRAVVALSPDDVPMANAFRFGTPPELLAMTGTADEINPLTHTIALYRHVPAPAWLVTVDGGSHLGTFTTDPDLRRIDAMIADFVFAIVDHDAGARAGFTRNAGGRIHLTSR